MPLPEMMIAPMRADLTRNGFVELRTPEQVDEAFAPDSGTVLVAINSACGCAGARMRPAVLEAIREAQPDRMVTVFAGQDMAATARAREFFAPEPPSSPAVAIMRAGELVYMMPRYQIERRAPSDLAAELVDALRTHSRPAGDP